MYSSLPPPPRSCTDLVQEIVDLHRKEGYADAEEELQELQRLREEATEWVRLGGLLAAQLKEGRGTGEEGEGPQRGEGKEKVIMLVRKSSRSGSSLSFSRQINVCLLSNC